jgi:hypothetical protein
MANYFLLFGWIIKEGNGVKPIVGCKQVRSRYGHMIEAGFSPATISVF